MKGGKRGKHPGDFSPGRPGRGSKPLSVSGSIRLRAFLDGRDAFLIPSPRACSWGVGRFTISSGILRRNVFTVPWGCVVSAPWLALSPGGFPPTPMASGEGTFLSGRLLPTRTTVSCPPPPGDRMDASRLDNGSPNPSSPVPPRPNDKKGASLPCPWVPRERGRRPALGARVADPR
jgi:hypothetical protein